MQSAQYTYPPYPGMVWPGAGSAGAAWSGSIPAGMASPGTAVPYVAAQPGAVVPYGAAWYGAMPGGGMHPYYPSSQMYGYPCGCGYSGSGAAYARQHTDMRDDGGRPFVINIEEAAERNATFRTAIWTGQHLQVVLMSIEPGSDIGLEVHPNVDQFIRIEEGYGLVQMGSRRDQLDFTRRVSEDDAIMIPAGTWHNLTNTGSRPLKLYTIYAPPEHPFGTVHRTKAEAEAAERS